MKKSRPVEAIITCVSSLKDRITSLLESYEKLPTIIDQEHAAIAKSDIQTVGQTGEQKNRLSGQMNEGFKEIQVIMERLAGLANIQGEPPKNLQECLQLVELCREDGDSLADQVLQHQLNGLEEVVAKFQQAAHAVQPLLVKNRFVVAKMLKNYQESYKFWLSIAEEAASSYDSAGVQKSKGRNSGFSAKA